MNSATQSPSLWHRKKTVAHWPEVQGKQVTTLSSSWHSSTQCNLRHITVTDSRTYYDTCPRAWLELNHLPKQRWNNQFPLLSALRCHCVAPPMVALSGLKRLKSWVMYQTHCCVWCCSAWDVWWWLVGPLAQICCLVPSLCPLTNNVCDCIVNK